MSAREYKIYSDSTCDLPEEYVKQFDIEVIKLSFEIDGHTYADGDMSFKEFYDKMRNGGTVKTAQISPDYCEKSFEKAIKEGYDILHLGFSSALSGSYNSACIARDSLLEKYPDAKIICVDSLCASTGQGLLLYKACEKKAAGMGIDDVAQWLEDNKLHLCHMFTVDDLKYLHRGGRVSKATAVAGTILGIKPVLHVDNEGRLIAVGKVRGRKQSLNKLIEMMEERIKGWDNPVIGICQGDCMEDAEYVAEICRQKLGRDIKVIISYTGTVIGAHSGPGSMAVFFMGEYR